MKSKSHRITPVGWNPRAWFGEPGSKPTCATCGERIYQTLSGNGWTHNPDKYK